MTKTKRIFKSIMLTFLAIIVIAAIAIFIFLKQPSFGADPSGARLERIKKSPHYVNGSFANLVDTPVMAPNTNYFKMALEYFKKVDNVEPNFTLPSIKTDLKAAPPARPTLTYFGHSAYMIQIDGKNILMDPAMSERISPVQWAGSKNYAGTHVFEVEDLPAIDFIMLSHDHYDHMDYETLKKFAGKPTRFIVPLGVGAHLEHWGIAPENITELDWWEETNAINGIHVTATPARHFSGRALNRGKSLWASYVLQTDKYKLFLGGDSGYEKHFAAIGEKFGPFDLAVLECGQYNEMWPDIHMMPEQTAQAGIDLGAKVVWPVHWGKFTLALHPWNESPKRISKRAEELRLKLTTPVIGEQIIVGTTYPNRNWWELPEGK
ncbi:MBL fold metallo-hydrolase [Dyadobacter sp. NIV53]|uniref:MBL fold metallo-hydrolase n=1 Tax=Dyadobacter sp. NIV53 TaxID=2861765 RepID=UPI001E2EEDBF|nr:MBL fold metallo-hydrolase [Dyadobacter sp. NIV53]